MGGLVKGIFGGGGGDSSALLAQQQQERRDAQLAQARQNQAAQDQLNSTDKALSGVIKQPRGQRLLLSGESGGLATTLGGST